MKNKLYEFRIYQDAIDRDKAVKSYKFLAALKENTAKIFSLYKTMGLRAPYDIKEQLNNLKIVYNEAISRPVKFFLKRGEYEYNDVLNYDRLHDCLNEIHSSIRVERRRARQSRHGDGIHQSKNYWFNKQIERAFNDKSPRDEKRYYGIELECLIPADADYRNELLEFRQYVSIAGDGSIDCDEENNDARDNGDVDDGEDYYEGKEFRILVDSENLIRVVTGVCEILQDLGAIVNKSCGLHVHFDQRDLSGEDRAAIYSKLYHSLNLLYSIVPSSRRKNTYCKRNTSGVYSENVQGTRYRAINCSAYHKHNTLEVRLFGGTLEPEKILNWIRLVGAIISGDVVLRCPTSFENAQKYWHFSDEVLAWCKARQVKFGTVGVSPSNEAASEVPELVEVR